MVEKHYLYSQRNPDGSVYDIYDYPGLDANQRLLYSHQLSREMLMKQSCATRYGYTPVDITGRSDCFKK